MASDHPPGHNGGEASDPACLQCGAALHACPACGARMPAAFRYCGHCGGALAAACPACAAVMPARFRYCGHCGSSLSGALPHSPAPPLPHSPTLPLSHPHGQASPALPLSGALAPAAVPQPEAAPVVGEQRRRVAILFADLSGSTALSDRLEVEVAYRLVSECVVGLGQVVTDTGGYVVKTLGDGLMALFGAPVAHGDDPLRAGQAALRMQEWLAGYGETVREAHGVELQLRVGINYGSVVAAPIAAGDRPQYDVLGDAVNVAQRLEAAAEPGAVCVSEAFYRITRARFEYRDLGLARVKGKPEPLPMYRLLRAAEGGDTRDTVLPLVGREAEQEALHGAAAGLGEGRGALLALVGAAGVGKSRLLDELASELVALGVPVLRAAADEGSRAAPLALWRDWLLELLPVRPGMEFSEAAAGIRAALAGPEEAEWADWLAALAVDPERLLALDPDVREHVTRAAIRAFLGHWRRELPAALLVDECGLLDSLSLRLLLECAGEAGAPLLVTLAGRETAGYPPASAEEIRLNALSPEDTRRLVRDALPGVAITDAMCAHLVERSGGSPLYLDLILRAAREAPNPGAVLSRVPDSVYGLIQAQVDAMHPEECRVARLAAVLGRTFPERWLAALSPPADEGMPGWHSLLAGGMLVEERPAPLRELAFRHGALQEVLYEGLLSGQRQEAHAGAARVIAAEAEIREDLAARVAWHWEQAGRPDEALPWTLTAAEHAAALYAGQEARELYERALELAARLERPAAAARAAIGLAELASHRGEFATALALYEQAERHLAGLEAAPEGCTAEETAMRGAVRLGHARVLARTGSLAAATPLLAEALALLESADTPSADREYVRCLIEQAHVFCDLGLLEEAERSAKRALERAEAEAWDPEASAAGAALGLVYPLLGNWPAAERQLWRAAQLAESYRDWQGAAACWNNLGSGLLSAGRYAEAGTALNRALEQAERIGDAEKTAMARMNLGLVHLNRGDWGPARDAFAAAVPEFRAMDHPLGVTASLYNLADTLRWAGETEAVAPVLEEAEALGAGVDAPFLQTHLILARAELHLARGETEPAASLALRAIRLAVESEYESGTNLGRLTLGRARRALRDLPGAREVLTEAVEGFSRSAEPLEGARARAELAAVLGAQGEDRQAEFLLAAAVDALEQLDALPWRAHFPEGLQVHEVMS